MQVVVQSLLTNYQRQGSGTQTVVLLHGWGDSAAGLAQLQHVLSKGYTVIAVDLPGFGGTQAPETAWGLDDYACFIAAFLEKIKAGPVWCLIGHSNGGAIAIRGLGKGILQAERLALLASAGVRGSYKGRIKVIRYATKLGKALTIPLPKTVKNKLRKKVYSTVGSDMLVAEHLQATFKKVITDDVRADAAKLDLPVLLIYGEDDQQTPVAYGEALYQAIPHATLEILPHAGHFVHRDRAADVQRLLVEFLR